MEDELKDCMNGTLVEYYADDQLKNSWDKIQVEVYIKVVRYPIATFFVVQSEFRDNNNIDIYNSH